MPSSSLVPENDPSVLFTTAGMQQFKTYYTGDRNALKDFGSKNTTTVQKCVRTSDIDEVGDATHLTFFEMLGNFSFGGYGRKEAITYAHDFITKELNLPISYVTFFKGNANVPRDDESKMIWEKLGVKDVREEGSDVFWGPTGESGPCGPTTEIYCKNAEGIDVEIWNIVFNEYFCDGTREMLDNGEARFEKLPTLGIDTGMGFERLLATVQNKKNVFETDVFDNEHTRESRIVADHVKAALFMISDGVIPSNTGQGYVLRRLIRRAVRFSKQPLTSEIEKIKKIYQGVYVLDDKGEIEKEEGQFRETLSRGMKEFEKGIDAFTLFSSYGFPLELTLELAKEKGIEIDVKDFANKFKEHQDLSRAGAEKKFKGGLGDTSEISVRYHTATHLLHQALHDVLKTAENAGGEGHHFKAVQLPYNLGMAEAFGLRNQMMGSQTLSLLQAAYANNLAVFTSASILQSKLSRNLPPVVAETFTGLQTDAQRAIQFVRSTKGVTAALVGMKRKEHLEENLKTGLVAPAGWEKVQGLFNEK